jgi:predicted nucleotidyltransferase
MIRKNTKEIIKEYFFMNPTIKLRVRGIEKLLKLSLPSVIRYSNGFVKEGILKIIEMGGVTFFCADRSSFNYILGKKLFNLKKLYNSGVIDYIKMELNNPVIVVFGSYSLGEDIEQSDIDLYLETSSKKKLNLDKFEKVLQRKFQVFKFSNIRKIPNSHLINNILNGFVLNKQLEVFK